MWYFLYFKVDDKSYLLDFKGLSNEDSENNSSTNILSSVPTPVQTGIGTSSSKPSSGHHTMEFFEMCAALIIQLAR